MKPSQLVCTCETDWPIHPVEETIRGKQLIIWVCDECSKFVCHALDEELANGLSGVNSNEW